MNESAMIGSRIRELRLAQRLTLKQVSEESGLSVGFLSQLERGMSSIAIDSLATLAKILNVNLSSFFQVEEAAPDVDTSPIFRSYDLRSAPISPTIIQYVLSHNIRGQSLLPRLFHLQPQPDAVQEDIEMYSHAGEEFTYILEGIVTVYLDAQVHTLYPGDSFHIPSNVRHNWANLTNKPAKLLSINYPNPFHSLDEVTLV